MREILGNEGEIVVLGDPRFPIQRRDDTGKTVDVPFLWWSAMTFHWEGRSGKSNTDVFVDYRDRNRYGRYLRNGVGSTWTYYLVNCELNQEVTGRLFHVKKLEESRINIDVVRSSFRQNRYGGALAFEVSLALYKRTHWQEHADE